MTQAISLNSVYEGTTWNGIPSITLQRQNGTPISLSGAEIEMRFRRAGERMERLLLTIGGGIQILNEALGVFKIPPRILPLTAGTYYWDMLVTLASGEVLLLLVGTQEITRIGLPS